jgi:lactate permease
LGWILLLGLSMAGTQYFLAVAGFWNIATFGAGIAGILMGILLSWLHERNQVFKKITNVNWRQLLVASSGYAILLVLTMVIELIPYLGNLIDFAIIKVQFAETKTALGYLTPAGDGRVIHIFRHAGMILVYASLISYWIYTHLKIVPTGSWLKILKDTLVNLIPSSLGIATLVSMAVIMLTSGMTETIARGLAAGVGVAFGFISPWIGAIGSFITGSNTNSNLLFGLLQKRTAELLGLNIIVILAAQTTGGSIGCAFAPTRIIVGTITVNSSGEEGKVLRKVLPYSLVLLLVIGIIELILAVSKL